MDINGAELGSMEKKRESIAITSLYAVGSFTDENGNPGSNLLRVAIYNITTGLFSALGDGFNGTASVVTLDKNNVPYVGGFFTLSGSTTIRGIAKWNGSAWVELGFGLTGTNFTINDISIGNDGRIYVAGVFTEVSGAPAQGVADGMDLRGLDWIW
jgi:hypothetical protein